MRAHAKPPRGALLLEAAMATSVLILAIGALAAFVALLERQRASVERREQAALLAANVMDRLMADAKVREPGEHAIDLIETDGTRPTGLTATVHVAEEPLDADIDDSPRWLSVRLELRWPGPSRTHETLRLATWRRADAGRSP